MPHYDYRCKSCGKEFEFEQRMTEDPLSKCIYCEGPVQRLISPAGIVFKGSGFHVTDYRPKKGETASPTQPAKAATKPAEKGTTSTPAASSPAPSGSPTSSSTSAKASPGKPLPK